MRVRNNPMIPLTAVAAGLLAGAVGTVCLDAVQYLKYRRGGGTDSPAAWEFAPVENWETAPDPGQVAKRVIEGFTQRKLPDRSAWLISTIAHWGYGSAAGAAYGIVAGSLPRPHPGYGLALGSALFADDYIALPIAGLYKPIWEYDAKTLAWDLGAHLAYGAGTGTTFWLVSRIVLLDGFAGGDDWVDVPLGRLEQPPRHVDPEPGPAGRVAIVTGASRGIGQALVRSFPRHRARCRDRVTGLASGASGSRRGALR